MNPAGKRLYTELNRITIENGKNPNLKKFIIDETPFNDDESEPPVVTETKEGKYFTVIGRILPKSNIYNRSAFKIELKIPIEFPFKPPEVKMLTPIYHPNIRPEGKICIPMLRHTERWQSTNSLIDVINAVVNYIDNPNVDEAHSSDIANEYQRERAEFDRKATEIVQKNMLPRQ